MRMKPVSVWIVVISILLLGWCVRGGEEEEELWQEWGETEESMRAAKIRRAKRMGKLPNVPPPSSMTEEEFNEAMLNQGIGGAKQKMMFVKLDGSLVGTKEDGESLAAKWATMVRNAGMGARMFPMSNEEMVIQYEDFEFEKVKRFLFRQVECTSITVDEKEISREDFEYDEEQL